MSGRDRPEEGAPVELRIDTLAGPDGLGRQGRLVWLVPGALPGDRIQAVATRRHPRHVEGRLVRIVEPSAARRAPVCAVQDRCGGCPWMPLDEDGQRASKQGALREALRRIGGFRKVPMEPLLAPSPDLGYRNKVEFTLVRVDGVVRPALRGRDGAAVPVGECPVLDPIGNAALASARRALRSARVGAEAERLIVRVSATGSHALLALRGPGPAPGWADAFAREVRARDAPVAGVVWITARPGRRGGTTHTRISGDDRLVERVGGVRFRIPPATFFQVGRPAAEALQALVLDASAAADRPLDLYSGVGTYSVPLAGQGKTVLACEADRDAAAASRRAAVEAGCVSRFRVVHDRVGRFLERGEAGDPDLVIANPPRTGLERGVAERIAALGAERIVSVSCEPATLARDLARLRAGGYGLVRVTPVDLFPQTHHVEAVAVMDRSPRSGSATSPPATSD